MKINKAHPPGGTYDIMPSELKQKKSVISSIMDVFENQGYLEVETPTFEFFNVFQNASGSSNENSIFKFTDNQGKILALRPDMTTSAARLAVTKFSPDKFPLRLSYEGHAFRNNEIVYGMMTKEFTQAGIELYGDSSPAADSEIIATTIKALIASGLTNFQIELGHAGLFKGLLNNTNINATDAEALRAFVDVKDFVSVKKFIADFDMPDNIRNLLSELPYMFGSTTILNEYDFPDGDAANAIMTLKNICDNLTDMGYEKYISIDLGMVKKLDYYTGTIFNGFTKNMGYYVCGGGRYDNLCAEFGKSCPATGVAIGIDRLLTALNREERK